MEVSCRMPFLYGTAKGDEHEGRKEYVGSIR